MKNQTIQIEKSKYMLLLERVIGFKKAKGGHHFAKALKDKLRNMGGTFIDEENQESKLDEMITDLRLIVEYHDMMQMPDEDMVREPLDDDSITQLVKASTTKDI